MTDIERLIYLRSQITAAENVAEDIWDNHGIPDRDGDYLPSEWEQIIDAVGGQIETLDVESRAILDTITQRENK